MPVTVDEGWNVNWLIIESLTLWLMLMKIAFLLSYNSGRHPNFLELGCPLLVNQTAQIELYHWRYAVLSRQCMLVFSVTTVEGTLKPRQLKNKYLVQLIIICQWSPMDPGNQHVVVEKRWSGSHDHKSNEQLSQWTDQKVGQMLRQHLVHKIGSKIEHFIHTVTQLQRFKLKS